jgi:hypothetical protein
MDPMTCEVPLSKRPMQPAWLLLPLLLPSLLLLLPAKPAQAPAGVLVVPFLYARLMEPTDTLQKPCCTGSTGITTSTLQHQLHKVRHHRQ